MNLARVFALLGVALPVCGQYAGPAILSRGEAPSAMSTKQLAFRPYVEATGTYDSGLAGVVLDDQGGLANQASAGMNLAWGVSGLHRWRYTKVGLDYRGSLAHFAKRSYYDSLNQSIMLGVTHQLSRHTTLSLRESAGIFSRDYGLRGLSPTVPFDPSASYIPVTDFFDNRTAYFTTQADLGVQKTSRLSFDLGGDGFFVRRRSKALAGVTGGSARGDVEYRISRNSTIGAQYTYNHFDFSRTFGGTDIHGASLAYAVQLTRFLEFSGYGGIMRVESKYIRAVPIDPVIAAILGISQGTEVAHRINYVPNWSARLSRTFSNGVAYIGGGQTVTPGNGLFLTSYAATMLGGYTYTGLRRWSFSMQAGFIRSKSVTNVTGAYTNSDATISASRQIFPSVHFVASYSARQYSSPDFSKYNRFVQTATIGLGFAPGDVPLRVR